jgi:cytochrome c oxidase subunit I
MTAIPHPLAVGHHDDAHAHDAHGGHEELGFLRKYVFSADHKIIGIQFLFMGLFFFVVGGLLAMLIRWQLGWPGARVPILSDLMGWPGGMPPDFYTMVFSMHASIMIFFVIIPLLVGTFGNYLIPLKIGAGDMAFPFLNGLAFWSALPAGTILLAGFMMPGGAAAAGWTSYPPLSAIQFQGGGAITYAANLLRPANSTWPMLPVLVNFFALFMLGGFITAWYVKLERNQDRTWFERLPLGLILILIGAGGFLLPTAGYQWRILMPFGALSPAVALFIGLAGVAYVLCGLNAALGTFLSTLFALFAVRFVQRAAFDGQSAWFLSIFLLGFSSLMGAVNYLTTIIKLRTAGMTMFRMPLSVWSLFITSLLVLLATPVLASTLLMNLLDHHRITSFFQPYNWVLTNQIQSNSGGGYAILHQHLFWFYSHPAVYIMILPAMGMVSDILPVFARKPIFGYRPMVYAMAGIAFLGFIVWAHHMFQSGMNPTLGTTFAVSTMFIAVPSAIKTFNWLGTLWGGNIRFTTPMWNAIAFVAMFVIGGLSGIFMASTAIDVHIHDTYFIVAHIHYVLFGGSMFGLFGAMTFWYPKMFGRMMNETLGKIHFWLTFVTFNCTFFAMHILGVGGFPRRIADYMNYSTFAPYKEMNQFISYSAFALGLAQIPFAINFIGSWIWGPVAPQNPWEATTLEWNDAPTPPPHGNFAKAPIVHHGPYEYSSPLVEEDWLPQTRYVDGAEQLVVKH